MVLLPSYLLYTGKHNALAAWICCGVYLDIFNSQQYLNFTLIKGVSIPLFFKLISDRKRVLSFLSSPHNRIWLVYFGYLSILYVAWGVLWPWSYDPLIKTGRDIPQWRGIIHLSSIAMEFLVAVYIGHYLLSQRRTKNSIDFWPIAKWLLAAATICCLGAVLERTFEFDFYHYFTQGDKHLDLTRSRGFAFEPRGLAQNAMHGFIILLLFRDRISNVLQLLLTTFFFYTSFVLTFSTSGTITLMFAVGLGLCFSVIQFARLGRRNFSLNLKQISLGIILLVTAGMIFFKAGSLSDPKRFKTFLLSSNHSFSERFEVFDAAAVEFFIANPKFLVTGVGPGLMSIPSFDYLSEEKGGFWIKHGQLLALPLMGIVLILSNGGLIALFILGTIFLTALRKIYPFATLNQCTIRYFSVFLGLYMLQIRPSYLFVYALTFAFYHYGSFEKEAPIWLEPQGRT